MSTANNNIVSDFDSETNDNLKITLKTVDAVQDCLVLVLKGYVDTYNSKFFQGRVALVFEAGYTRLIFDCAELNYLSSTGIGLFTAFVKTAKQKGGDIVLISIQPKVYEVFQLLGFDQFFNIRETLPSAFKVFEQIEKIERSVFPVVFPCPICEKKLKAEKQGRFRCSGCKTILSIDENGNAALG